MTDCAALGSKHPGSPAGHAQGDRVAQRLREAGLEVTTESFHLPVWEPGPVTATALAPGEPASIPAESFAYGGTGRVEAEVVDAGGGSASEFAGKDVRGKIVMVSAGVHRTVQVQEVVKRGGAAMLSISGTPNNLIQTGAVSWAYRPPAPIPTVTIGADDGARLHARMEQGTLRMALSVEGRRIDREGRNVIGVRRGTRYPDRYVLVAGHYDSWHAGAVDNCTAVGSLIEMAHATKDVAPAYTTLFVGWDAEEVGLVGSSAWIYRHLDLIPKIVLNINLEMTSVATYLSGERIEDSVGVAGTSSSPALLATLVGAAATNLYTPVVLPLLAYRQISGGIIPTDLEHFYGMGVQGFSTASITPWYHTIKDTANTVIGADLQRVTDFLTDALSTIQLVPPEALAIREVPRLAMQVASEAPAGAAVPVELRLTSTDGRALAGATVELYADQRDSWSVATGKAEDVGGGRYRWTLPAGSTDADLTRVRARVQDPLYIATAYATVDQRRGGALAPGSVCRSRRVETIRLRRPRHGRIVSVRATSSRGKVRVLRGGRRIRVDMRGVERGIVTVKVRVRLSGGRVQRQTRRYRTCSGPREEIDLRLLGRVAYPHVHTG